MTYGYNDKKEVTSITTGSTTYNFTYDALGRMSAYTNDNIRYYYTPDGKLSSMIYGSGEFEYRYTYDELGRLAEESYYCYYYQEWEEDGEIFWDGYYEIEPIKKYEYTADGKLYRVYDVLNDEYTHYSYDVAGRLEHVIRYKSDMVNDFTVDYFYSPIEGKEHLISSQSYYFNYSVGNNAVYEQMWYSYDYNDDDSLESLRVSSGSKDIDVIYSYDSFKRPSTTTVTDGSFTSTTTYGYKTTGGVTTGEVSNYTVQIGSTTKNYTYTYDSRGNIKTIRLNGALQCEYFYDDLGQLYLCIDYASKEEYYWEYDYAGNITYFDVIGQEDGDRYYWYYNEYIGDKLVSFDGESITYDEYGRTTYYRGKTISYYEYDFNRIQSIGNASFTYDAEGMRASKTVNGVTHYYTYDGLKLIREEWGNNVLVFLYDAYGSPIGMQYRTTSYAEDVWDTYYYEKNLQGDVIAIYNASGTKLVNYAYDPFGRIVSMTDGNGNDVRNNASHLGNINPLRYRGYYYDRDLSLYYLAARYYDPFTARFITADSYVSTGQGILGYNRYAYCGNNPVMYMDYTGESPIAIIGVAMLLVGIVKVAIDLYKFGKSVDPYIQFGKDLTIQEDYKGAYCEAVSHYYQNENLDLDATSKSLLNEVFHDNEEECINCIKFDIINLKNHLGEDDIDRIKDVDYLYEHFSEWAIGGSHAIAAPSMKKPAESGMNLIIQIFKSVFK